MPESKRMFSPCLLEPIMKIAHITADIDQSLTSPIIRKKNATKSIKDEILFRTSDLIDQLDDMSERQRVQKLYTHNWKEIWKFKGTNKRSVYWDPPSAGIWRSGSKKFERILSLWSSFLIYLGNEKNDVSIILRRDRQKKEVTRTLYSAFNFIANQQLNKRKYKMNSTIKRRQHKIVECSDTCEDLK